MIEIPQYGEKSLKLTDRAVNGWRKLYAQININLVNSGIDGVVYNHLNGTYMLTVEEERFLTTEVTDKMINGITSNQIKDNYINQSKQIIEDKTKIEKGPSSGVITFTQQSTGIYDQEILHLGGLFSRIEKNKPLIASTIARILLKMAMSEDSLAKTCPVEKKQNQARESRDLYLRQAAVMAILATSRKI